MFENRRKEKQMAKANKVSDYSILIGCVLLLFVSPI